MVTEETWADRMLREALDEMAISRVSQMDPRPFERLKQLLDEREPS